LDPFKKYFGDLFIPLRLYVAVGSCIILLVLAFFIKVLFPVILFLFWILVFLVIADYIFLFFSKPPLVQRIISDRLSNGDENKVIIKIRNRMAFRVRMDVIDELPVQFQQREFVMHKDFAPRQQKHMHYTVRPSSRGEYDFGDIRIYVRSLLGLVMRRHVSPQQTLVPVYPSYMQLRKYQLITKSAVINEHGSKRMRKIGSSMEFEQIKDYVTGDDIRNVNWKATARTGLLMINNFVDEKSQQVYCIIDKGRLMKMPFNGLTLLDYAINSTLVLTNVCLEKQDRIGLMTFSDKIGSVVPADRKMVQREHILQVLYRQQTSFYESDFEMLYTQVRNKIKQRSLLVLYTNFESLNGLKRQMNYLRSIARHHLLLVVFFENTELQKLSQAEAHNIEDVYVKTIAGKFAFEKRLIVKELQKYGILSILTSPQNLTINTVNKYLELKSKQAL
jgi:uncharacterized protein (DUF58 family)